MPELSQRFPVGSRVRIESVESWLKTRDAVVDQARIQNLVGQDRVVVDVDRYGDCWLGYDDATPTADFRLSPLELSLVALPQKEPEPEESLPAAAWEGMKRTTVTVGPSTLAVVLAAIAFVGAGIYARYLDQDARAEVHIESLAFYIPAVLLLVATALAAALWVRRRHWQYGVELLACAGLWTVLMVAL